MRTLDIAVVGCGTAGGAAALFLSRAGHRVTVLERVPTPGPVGAGIMMQPSGLAVLERLGLQARVIERGARVDHLQCETPDGHVVLDLEYEALDRDLYGIGLHRGVLFETLHGAIVGENVPLLCGVAIERARREKNGTHTLLDETGDEHGPYDLVVVCDGARSHLRDTMPGLSKRVEPYPWGALWFIGEDPDDEYGGRLFQVVEGTQTMIGLLPTGLGPGDHETPVVSLFFSLRADRLEEWRAGGLDEWKQGVRDLVPNTEPVLDQIHDQDQLTFASYWDVTMPRWHAPGVVLLGDAAHATSPQLGQGCNLALCDAMELANQMAQHETLEDALEAYTAARRDHLAFYQLATRWLTPFFQSDLTPLAWVRDWAMGPFSKLPFVSREMVRSMAGTKSGYLFGDIRF